MPRSNSEISIEIALKLYDPSLLNLEEIQGDLILADWEIRADEMKARIGYDGC